jgi:hypothetical protein
MLKYPSVKSVCPTLISKEGAGKGTLLKLLRRMMGKNKIMETTTPSRDVCGDFNGRMNSSFLINLNELSQKETKESEGKIKGLITDDVLTINQMGLDQHDVVSYHRFIVTRNNEEPLKTKKGDKRNFIIRSSDELCGNKDYFDELYDMLKDDNVIYTMYNYFIDLPDLDKFNLLSIPTTEYQKDLQIINMCPIEHFMKDWTSLNIDFKNEDNKPFKTILASSLFKEFLKYPEKNKIIYEINNVKFSVRLTRMNINGVSKGNHTKKGNTWNMNIDDLKKTYNLKDLKDFDDYL